MKRHTILIVWAVALYFVGCSMHVGESYWPEPTEESRWEYDVSYTMLLAGVQKGKLIVRVCGVETIGDKRHYKHVAVYADIPGSEASVSYYRWAPNGVYAVDAEHVDMPEYLDTSFPLTVGTTWTVKESEATIVYKAEENEDVELPDKTYKNCLKASFERTAYGSQMSGVIYFAKGIGQVRIIYRTESQVWDHILTKSNP